MNVSKTNLVNLAQHISTSAASLGHASAMLAAILAGEKPATPETPAAPAPNAQAKVTQTPAQGQKRTPSPAVSVSTQTVIATVGKDGRVKLSRAMFETLPSITVNGRAYQAGTSTDSRVKVTGTVFGAKVGEKVTFYRKSPGVWFTTVTTPDAPAQETPKASGRKAKSQAAPAATMADFFGTVQAQVKDAQAKGIVNENYPVGDPRRHMTRAERKTFNRSVTAETRKAGVKDVTTRTLADMAQAIGQRVYDVPASV
jgi:hypothetical protein